LRRRRERVLKLAKGFRGPRSKLARLSQESVDRALKYSYRDRRTRKRDFRRLWITRISAAVRDNDMSYSKFINALKQANISLDRKILSDMAIHDPDSFARLIKTAKDHIASA